MSSDFYARIVGMIIFGALGTIFGINLVRYGVGNIYLTPTVLGLVGVLFGLILSPMISTRPIRKFRLRVGRVSTNTFIASLLGIFIGLILAALFSYPLSLLPSPFGDYFPFIGALVSGYLGVVIFSARQEDVLSFLPLERFTRSSKARRSSSASSKFAQNMVLLDTSVIIDGRIEDIAQTGFLPAILLIPNFVLGELQHIADSSDSLRRQRGRRGIEVVSGLQKLEEVTVEISDVDYEDIQAVDEKLVVLAKETESPILTNDYNLNRVAEIQGVKILNINELANSVKAVFLPGENLNVEIIQEGKEYDQGVGYLDDGTMIVVENGSHYLGKEIETVVTKVLQTAAGRMIFARPKNG